MRPGLHRRRFTLVLLAPLAGCALGPPAEPPVTRSLLDQVPAGLPRRAASAATLLVFPPEARPALDTTQMAYTLEAHRIAYFAHNEWGETPPQMLQPLLVRTLEATGAFAAVVTTPFDGTATLGLRCTFTELVQDFAQDPPVLRLGLRASLSDEPAGRVLGTREIRIDAPMAQKNPAAGVQAANDALARALRELAAFVLERAP